MPKRPKLSPRIRQEMYRRHGVYRGTAGPVACAYCDVVGILRWALNNRTYSSNTTWLAIDHVVPVAHGGTDDIDNLEWACHDCNLRKGSRLDWTSPNGYLVDGQRLAVAA